MPLSMAPLIEGAVAAGHLSVTRLWQELEARAVPFEQTGRFRNINSQVRMVLFIMGITVKNHSVN